MAWINQMFAFIKDDRIQRIESYYDYEIANEIAFKIYGSDVNVIDVTQFPVKVGDLFQKGRFFRPNDSGGVDFIERIPTQKEQAAELRNENATLVEMTINSQVRLVELENGI